MFTFSAIKLKKYNISIFRFMYTTYILVRTELNNYN